MRLGRGSVPECGQNAHPRVNRRPVAGLAAAPEAAASNRVELVKGADSCFVVVDRRDVNPVLPDNRPVTDAGDVFVLEDYRRLW